MTNFHYIRMSLTARQHLARAMNDKKRELYNGVMVAYTSSTINLLTGILERIDKKTGEARIAFSVLMEITGIKSRETIARHVFLLEKAGCVAVRRMRVAHDRMAINVFRLLGDVAVAFLGEKWLPKSGVAKIHRTDIYRYDHRTDINKNNDDDDPNIDPSIKDLLLKIETILDVGIGEKMIARHGVASVEAWYVWVTADERRWSKNPGGLLVSKLATGQMPPVSKLATGNELGKWKDADLVDENDKPKDFCGAMPIGFIETETETVVYPAWSKHEWVAEQADAEIKNRLGLSIVRDECSLWLIHQDDKKLVIGYDWDTINLRYPIRAMRYEGFLMRCLTGYEVTFEQGKARDYFMMRQVSESAVV